MMNILLACKDLAAWSAFKAALDESDTQIRQLDSGHKVLAAIAEERFDLLVADENLGDMTGLELIKSVIIIQPMLNCAVVSTLSPAKFHEASEGLGVLMQLPVEPDKGEADRLLQHLTKIRSL
jgi:DNA-binding NtrC family response regulator